jgi:hypothetical protein
VSLASPRGIPFSILSLHCFSPPPFFVPQTYIPNCPARAPIFDRISRAPPTMTRPFTTTMSTGRTCSASFPVKPWRNDIPRRR